MNYKLVELQKQINIIEDVCPAGCGTAGQGVAGERVLKAGMKQKAHEFFEKGPELRLNV